MNRGYTVVGPEVWDTARTLYETKTAPQVCAVLGVTEPALRRRAGKEGWNKKDLAAARAEETALRIAAALAGTGAPESVEAAPGAAVTDNPRRLAEIALALASEALARGDAHLAQAHIKAGLAVGEFAELVKLLRKRDGGEG